MVATTPDQEGFDGHHLGHLSPPGAENPQQSQLPDALSHDQGEGVEGNERRNDQDDDGKGQQEVPQQGDVVGKLRVALVDQLLLGDHLDVGAEAGPDGPGHFFVCCPRRQLPVDEVIAAAVVQEFPGGGHVPGDCLKRHPGGGVEEVQVADQFEVERAGGGGHFVTLADHKVVVSTGEMIDGELVGPDGSAADAVGIGVDRGEDFGFRPAVSQLSPAAGIDGLAVAVDGNHIEFLGQSRDCLHLVH